MRLNESWEASTVLNHMEAILAGCSWRRGTVRLCVVRMVQMVSETKGSKKSFGQLTMKDRVRALYYRAGVWLPSWVRLGFIFMIGKVCNV